MICCFYIWVVALYIGCVNLAKVLVSNVYAWHEEVRKYPQIGYSFGGGYIFWRNLTSANSNLIYIMYIKNVSTFIWDNWKYFDCHSKKKLIKYNLSFPIFFYIMNAFSSLFTVWLCYIPMPVLDSASIQS